VSLPVTGAADVCTSDRASLSASVNDRTRRDRTGPHLLEPSNSKGLSARATAEREPTREARPRLSTKWCERRVHHRQASWLCE